MYYTSTKKIIVSIALLFFYSILVGCGKSQMPSPVMPTNLFNIEKANILVYENCLVAEVFFKGSYTALYQVELELEERDFISEKNDCPIKPTVVEIAPTRELNKLNEERNFIFVQYCPKKALKPYYRWRIKARHYLYKVHSEYTSIEVINTVENKNN